MARVLGIRANTVVASAFALSGLLAGVAAILLTAQTGTVSPTIGVSIVSVRVHRDDRRRHGEPLGRGRRRLLDRCPDGRSAGLAAARPAAISRRIRLRSGAGRAGRPAAGVLPSRSVLAREVPRRADLSAVARRLARGSPRHRRAGLRAETLPGERRPLEALLVDGLWPLLALMALTCIVSLVAVALGPDSLDRVVLAR